MRVLVVGGGAAGLTAAVCAARRGREVILTEAQPRVGRKLLATGNGRCNLTNLDMSIDHYHGTHVENIAPLLAVYPPERVCEFFAELGLQTAVEDGRVYPGTFAAASVLDALRLAARDYGVREMCDKRLVSLKHGDEYAAKFADGTIINAHSAILAMGGRAGPQLGASGDICDILSPLSHTIMPQTPALTPIETETVSIKPLNGLRVRCAIALLRSEEVLREERGEVLFAEYGMSGIAAMQLSRDVSLNDVSALSLCINFAPDVSCDDLSAKLSARKDAFPKRTLEEFLIGMFHRLLGIALFKAANIAPLNRTANTLTEHELRSLAHVSQAFTLKITGTRGFRGAQVTVGGADIAEFDVDTMESRLNKRLHVAGEALNIDGDCGGYNLHWAFATGMIAGGNV